MSAEEACRLAAELQEEFGDVVTRVAERTIARTLDAYQVTDTSDRNGRLEYRSLGNRPICHKATVADAGDAQPVFVNPRIVSKCCLYAVHQVLMRFAAPFAGDAALKLHPISR